MKKTIVFLLAFLLLGPECLFADMLLKQDGQVENGRIIAYDGKSFTVISREGREEAVNINLIKKIVFDGSEPVTLETKLGTVTAKLKKVENSQLTYDDNGKVKQISLNFVQPFDLQDRSKKVEVIAHGQKVDLKKHLVAGKVVVFDFYADWCGPCRQLGPKLEDLIGRYDDVVMKKIDIVDWNSAVVRQHNIKSVPSVWVFNKDGVQVGQPTHNFTIISQIIETARLN